MRRISTQSNESGIVSIISVIFFIILMSILTVSFLRIVADEQEQVIQDDLSKGALAAARSGVEDAKRALLYCRSLTGAPATQIQCNNDLKVTTCPGIFNSLTIKSGLGLTGNQLGDGSIKVGDPNPANNNNQRYTCVTLAGDTPDYIGKLSDGLGEFIPLRAVGSFSKVRISWHFDSLDGAGAAIPTAGDSVVTSNVNPRLPEWQNAAGIGYISIPRVQLVQFVPGSDLLSQQDSSSATYLVPNDGGSSTVDVTGGALNRNSIIPKRHPVNCTGAQRGYKCTATLNLSFARPAGAQYYLLVKSQYGTPHYKVEMLDVADNPVQFDDVQPQVDSTGAAANVYKRIVSRVAYQNNGFFTSNAIESGLSLCKDFSVTISVFTNPCEGLLLGAQGIPPSSNGPGAAGIGTFCSFNICIPGVGGQFSWTETLANVSQNDRANVTGCTWSFGDGSPNLVNQFCNYGDNFFHTFPVDPTYLPGDNPAKAKKTYTVTLTVNLRSGGVAADQHTFYLPENYP